MDRNGWKPSTRDEIRGAAQVEILCLQRKQVTIPCSCSRYQFGPCRKNYIHERVQGTCLPHSKQKKRSHHI